MKHYLLLLFLCAILIEGCNQNEKGSVAKVTLQSRIDSLFATAADFSGVVLVADHDSIIYHKAFGFRDYDNKVSLNTNDIFELASVSKQFTAMVIMMLKEEGKLNYDDTIEKYLPNLPYRGITIRHLLTHTSGLPDYQALMDAKWDKSKIAGNKDILDYLIKYHPPVIFKPGDRYEYSNTGYVLLASIAEQASGVDFIMFCRDRIFKYLEMNSTDIRSNDEKKLLPNLAWGYQFDSLKMDYMRADSFPSSNYTIWLGNRKGPGRISATTTDLLKWDIALYNEKIISANALKEAFQPYRLNNDSLSYYGFGWMLSKSNNTVAHTGDNPGYKTKITRLIDSHRTCIILCNNAHRDMARLTKTLEQLVENN